MTYALMSLALIALAIAIDWFVTGSRLSFQPQTLKLMLMLLVLTFVFDNLIVGYGIVGYNESNTLGIFLPKMPIEDFSYAIAAAILVPSVMKRYE